MSSGRNSPRWQSCVLALALASAVLGCKDDEKSSDAGAASGSLRCTGDLLQRKQGTAWVLSMDCATDGRSCGEDDGGVPACLAPPCNEGDKDCKGEILIVCQQGAWVDEQDCAKTGLRCLPLLGGLPRCASSN